jgi:hypothetical protein
VTSDQLGRKSEDRGRRSGIGGRKKGRRSPSSGLKAGDTPAATEKSPLGGQALACDQLHLLKLARDPRSLAASLAALPSMSLIPFAKTIQLAERGVDVGRDPKPRFHQEGGEATRPRYFVM